MKKLILNPQTVYGRVIYYPACDFSEMLCHILDRKCLPESILNILKSYGYEIEGANLSKAVD